ncbi:MAG: 30S ribosome-binding factor RbfA [Lachnospiraceae bacterium]|nr:30S ribosome-binding factor RbfA [Lachnospiraceae bacterium]
MRKNSTKNRIVSREVRRELSKLILEEVRDPRVSSLTMVTDVYVAPDLKTAKVYVSAYGDENSRKDTLEGLRNAAPFLRSMLAKNLNMRYTPQLFFVEDNSLEYGMKMDAIIASLHEGESDAEEAENEDGKSSEDEE